MSALAAALCRPRLRPVLCAGVPRLVAHQCRGTSSPAGGAAETWQIVPPLRTRLHRLPSLYASLGKAKLSALVVATTAAGFQLSPMAGDWPLLGCTAAGVALSSLGANAFNQWLEAPFDSQMRRTKLRPLPTHDISPFHAFHFGAAASVLGVGVLAATVGALPAALSAANIALYAALYTPLKRVSIANTWIGAVVGAIPPVIGYLAGAGGGAAPSPLAALTLGAIVYCWQFPHFNSLSWNLRGDYSRAGYCMASVLSPRTSLAAALHHALLLLPLSYLAVYAGLCTPYFALDSTPLNAALVYLAFAFRQSPSRHTARTLFLFSLLHLPLLLLLMVLHRRRPAAAVE